jgi:predicted nucleic acid-binding protein
LAEELDCELWTADERFWRLTRTDFPFVRWLGGLSVAE